MRKAKEIAEDIMGHVEWVDARSGVCTCPGESKHHQRTGIRDCMVVLEPIPTVHCFHTSCGAEVDEVKRELRRRIWNDKWSLKLPGGDVVEGLVSNRGEIQTTLPPLATSEADEKIAYWAQRLDSVLKEYDWPVAKIEASSPRRFRPSDGWSQFQCWLALWEENDVIWIGDVHASGHPGHARHFRPVSDWRRIGPVLGNFTSGSSFVAGSYTRSKLCVAKTKFLVVESDELKRDQVGAVFRFMRDRLKYPLYAVIDTGGKSLHGWFAAPKDAVKQQALKLCLTGLKCDPRMFTCSQPARVPGVYRDEKMQRLLYCV